MLIFSILFLLYVMISNLLSSNINSLRVQIALFPSYMIVSLFPFYLIGEIQTGFYIVILSKIIILLFLLNKKELKFYFQLGHFIFLSFIFLVLALYSSVLTHLPEPFHVDQKNNFYWGKLLSIDVYLYPPGLSLFLSPIFVNWNEENMNFITYLSFSFIFILIILTLNYLARPYKIIFILLYLNPIFIEHVITRINFNTFLLQNLFLFIFISLIHQIHYDPKTNNFGYLFNFFILIISTVLTAPHIAPLPLVPLFFVLLLLLKIKEISKIYLYCFPPAFLLGYGMFSLIFIFQNHLNLGFQEVITSQLDSTTMSPPTGAETATTFPGIEDKQSMISFISVFTELLSVKDPLVTFDLNVLAVYSILILSLSIIIFYDKKYDLNLLRVSIFLLGLSLFAITGFMEFYQFRGRSIWFLLNINLLLISLLLQHLRFLEKTLSCLRRCASSFNDFTMRFK